MIDDEIVSVPEVKVLKMSINQQLECVHVKILAVEISKDAVRIGRNKARLAYSCPARRISSESSYLGTRELQSPFIRVKAPFYPIKRLLYQTLYPLLLDMVASDPSV